MCGIAGYVSALPNPRRLSLLIAALDAIARRGPDDAGVMIVGQDGRIRDCAISGTDQRAVHELSLSRDAVEGSARIALGHRRFSITDPTSRAHQPFWSADRRVCVAFNGEIYNHEELRAELEAIGMRFRTTSDTEVLVNAYLAWGEGCLKRFNGFWALTLFDASRGQVLLARDRIGKAPLYYLKREGELFWCSEIKGILLQAPEERTRIDERSVMHFATWLRRDFDNGTFYRNIKTFPRASLAWVDDCGRFDARTWWSIPTARLSTKEISVGEAKREVQALLDDAVHLRASADVPVAAQLSGGMDSSAIVASVCQRLRAIPVFTVKYGASHLDEEPFARAVAQRYADRCTYHVVSPPNADLLYGLADYLRLVDEPFHSPNQFTNFRIWRIMAAAGYRVVIYGGGGDEVFAGYAADYHAPYLRMLLQRRDFEGFRREFFRLTDNGASSALAGHAITAAKMFPNIPRRSERGTSVFLPNWLDPLRATNGHKRALRPPTDFNGRMLANMADWRMNYWLRLDNQNSLAVPIEMRLPLLDHRLIEYCFQLPEAYLIRDGWTKWILRQATESRLPAEVVWRKRKAGFPFPLRAWLRSHRRYLAECLLHSDCPYVDARVLFRNFETLARWFPDYTWGLISTLLWWHATVNGATLPTYGGDDTSHSPVASEPMRYDIRERPEHTFA